MYEFMTKLPAVIHASNIHCEILIFSHTTTLFTCSQLAPWCSIRVSLYMTDMQIRVLKHFPAAVLLRPQLGCLSFTTRMFLG
jgi:hypothetical protein